MVEERQEQEMLSVIRAAARRTAITMGVVGFFVLALGAFMCALHFFGWDKSASKMPTAGIVALYFFGILFMLAGVGMMHMALFKSQAQGQAFLHRLQHEPARIREIYIHHLIGTSAPERLPYDAKMPSLGALYMVVNYTDNTQYQCKMKASQVREVLEYVATKAPHILDGFAA